MKKIHFLGNKRGIFTRHYHPIRVFDKYLSKAGFDTKYFSDPESNGIDQCDILIFFEASYRDILPIQEKNRKAAVDYLSDFFKKFSRVIWFDDHDSAGNLRTYVFPIVDKYAKAQILQDRGYYSLNKQMGIPHRDFVFENYGVEDKATYKGPITEEELAKLSISWNLALINWVYANEDSPWFKELFLKRHKKYKVKTIEPNLQNRKRSISYRANMWENIPTVGWWRRTTREYMANYQKNHPGIKINPPDRIDKMHYLHELANSIICPSPFGIGEICYRDFESFFCGALLLKPNMDHLITWPDLYKDGETYIAHRWDFSDFEEKLTDILNHPAKYEDVAREGQKRFTEALADGEGFVNQFGNMIQ